MTSWTCFSSLFLISCTALQKLFELAFRCQFVLVIHHFEYYKIDKKIQVKIAQHYYTATQPMAYNAQESSNVIPNYNTSRKKYCMS